MSIVTARSTKSRYAPRKLGLGGYTRPSKELFRENMDRRIRELDITASELAKRVGVHRAVVSNWLSGNSHPEARFYDDIAKALNTVVSKLFEDPTEPESIGMDEDRALRVIEGLVKRSKPKH